MILEETTKVPPRGLATHLLSERGSITVLVAFLIPIMVLLIALVLNIGQLLFEKIRLQNTVDACALAAATVQSVGLNEIADLNNELEREYGNLKNKILAPPTIWHNMNQGLRALNYYRSVFSHIRRYQERANRSYATRAKQIAVKVMGINKPAGCSWSLKSDIAARLTGYRIMPPRSVSFMYVPGSCKKCPPIPTTKWSNARAGTPAYIGPWPWYIHDGRYPSIRQALPPLPYVTSVRVRIKKSGQTTYSAFELTQEPGSFVLGGRLFGRTPVLRASAAAKPAGGHIYDCKPYYSPVMIR